MARARPPAPRRAQDDRRRGLVRRARPSGWATRNRPISQQIAALERIVGLRLIERPGGPRPISLTEAGQILLRHADAIQARLLAAKADMAALEAGDAGRLRVGTFQSVGAKIIPRLLRRFSDSHPQVEVVLRESQDESELLELIERGDLDLTFWTLPVAGGPYETVELLHDPYVLVLPAGSPLATLEAAADAEGDRAPADHRLQPLQRDGPRRGAARVDRPGAEHRVPLRQQRHRAGTRRRRGRAWPYPPGLTVDEDDPSIAVVDLHGRVPARVIGLVWHSDRHRSAAAEAFVVSAIDVCRELSAESAAA